MIDLLTLIPIGALTILLFYLSHREMKKSNALRFKLYENQKALRTSESARINELVKAAEFGRLSQGLFHDLMTPLTSMILHTENLKDKTTQKSLEKALEAGNRMTQYIQDIRTTLSHEEAERQCFLPEECESIINLLVHKAKSYNVQIKVIQKNNPSWFGNPIKIRQIFLNLLSNAIDSFETVTDGRKNMIRISLTPSSIEIQDNGCGISPQNLKRIGEPFFTTKSLHKGTGIGLSTVKSIVENEMKGTLKIESTEGVGTSAQINFSFA